MKIRHSLAAVMVIIGPVALSTHADATATRALAVSAGIAAGCEVAGQAGSSLSAAAIDFGARDQLNPRLPTASTPSSGTGALTVRCNSASSTVTVALDLGQNASGSTRRMASGSTYVDYELYQDAAMAQPIGTAPIAMGAFTAGQSSNLMVYGRVPNPLQAVAQAGATTLYTDQVAMTITF